MLNFYDLRDHRLIKTLPILEEIVGLAVLAPDHANAFIQRYGSQENIGKQKKSVTPTSSFVFVVVGEKGVFRLFHAQMRVN